MSYIILFLFTQFSELLQNPNAVDGFYQDFFITEHSEVEV